METNPLYNELLNHSKEIEHLSSVLQLIEWEQETYMPEGAATFRGEQIKLLAGLIHEKKISKEFTNLLSSLVDIKQGTILVKNLSDEKQSALKAWRRDFIIETALPKTFVEDFASLTSTAMNVWREARKNNDFKLFLPFLKKVVSFNQKKADYIGYQETPYDALLDLYEPGMKSKTVHHIFDQLKKGNIALLDKIKKKPQIDNTQIFETIDGKDQLEFSKILLKKIGYDFNYGRLDLSTHPFSSGSHPKDSRITTRIQPNDIFSCISTVLHEAGHSFYTMGLPEKEFGSPLCQAVSMGIHESQSRFWETRIGLSLPFMKFLVPLLQKTFPTQFKNLTPLSCYQATNRIEPSFIRVEADEITYPLHVILRFELEKAMIEGTLDLKELPEAWNAKMQEYLGITPTTDSLGCLQDVHWAWGAIGYFPTYALGNLYAAQIFTQFAKLHPDFEALIEKGDFQFIKKFLHDHVYQYGRQYASEELMHLITGKPFSAEPYVQYLQDKYSLIYQL